MKWILFNFSGSWWILTLLTVLYLEGNKFTTLPSTLPSWMLKIADFSELD